MLASVVLYRGHGLRQWDQLRQLAEVLGDGRQGEFVAGAARPSQAEAVQAKYAFEVCKQHLDLLPLSPRRGIGLGFAMSRAMSRAPSYILRGTLRAGVFGQHLSFSGQASQSRLLAR